MASTGLHLQYVFILSMVWEWKEVIIKVIPGNGLAPNVKDGYDALFYPVEVNNGLVAPGRTIGVYITK